FIPGDPRPVAGGAQRSGSRDGIHSTDKDKGMSFIYSFSSEWLKKKRTAASLLTVAGSFLIPLIVLVARIDDGAALVAAANRRPRLWEELYNRNWQLMGLLLLPMGVVLATSLFAQLEFRNNTWKQVCTTPQSLTTIFGAKLAILLVML